MKHILRIIDLSVGTAENIAHATNGYKIAKRNLNQRENLFFHLLFNIAAPFYYKFYHKKRTAHKVHLPFTPKTGRAKYTFSATKGPVTFYSSTSANSSEST